MRYPDFKQTNFYEHFIQSFNKIAILLILGLKTGLSKVSTLKAMRVNGNNSDGASDGSIDRSGGSKNWLSSKTSKSKILDAQKN